MNIRCPHCQTLFRVDPARVPPRGIRARCARCGGTFQIAGTTQPGAAPSPGAGRSDTWRDRTPPSPGPAAAPGSAGAAARSQPGVPTQHSAGRATPEQPSTGTPAGHAAGIGGHGMPAPAEPARGGEARPTGGTQAGGTQAQRGAPVFGSRDPNTRAQRIARALVSDIVAYHPERRDQAIEAGTLRSEFRDEIMKSWDEYVAQVGPETAKSTPFFRQALNDILARGEAVF